MSTTAETTDEEIENYAEMHVRSVMDMDSTVELSERDRAMIFLAVESTIRAVESRALQRVEAAIFG